MANQYKLAKEAFVSNLSGGSRQEINLVTLIAPASVFLWSTLQAKQSLFDPYTVPACLVDFLLNATAILFAMTYYSGNLYAFNSVFIVPALAILVVSQRPSKSLEKERKAPKISKDAQEVDPLPIKPFVSVYRGSMLVVTCAAILAVDFNVFPRRFAKVETWGTSLMDIGVGSFVFSAGTVAARPILKQQLSGVSRGLGSRLWTAGRHSLPLLLLGLIRLWSVKGLDYAEHVTEYGVHWNFFFTMAFISPFVALADSAFRILPSYAILALLLAVVYQIILDSTELTAFMLIAPRTNLFSQNREGIFSFFGYLAIFLAGQGTGMYILPRPDATSKEPLRPTMLKLAFWATLWTSLLFLCTDYKYGLGMQVSRRLANLPYFLWIAAFNCAQITLFCGIEMKLFPDVYKTTDKNAQKKRANEACSKLLRAYNRNGLAIFLLANLLTGLVNLTLPTLTMGDREAMGVLVGYMAVISAAALGLDYYDISIKL
ncbi:MAG: Glucosaminyl phosphatidylinositol (GlcN-PI) nositol acylation protein [Chrysothrix sp. TS-e1954]|nr:MAG: Glucosaminyl phosphatidylinositol (GlcN-PI) nositol acylation protein [Chrysothrix sp. TS-e1954]